MMSHLLFGAGKGPPFPCRIRFGRMRDVEDGEVRVGALETDDGRLVYCGQSALSGQPPAQLVSDDEPEFEAALREWTGI